MVNINYLTFIRCLNFEEAFAAAFNLAISLLAGNTNNQGCPGRSATTTAHSVEFE